MANQIRLLSTTNHGNPRWESPCYDTATWGIKPSIALQPGNALYSTVHTPTYSPPTNSIQHALDRSNGTKRTK